MMDTPQKKKQSELASAIPWSARAGYEVGKTRRQRTLSLPSCAHHIGHLMEQGKQPA